MSTRVVTTASATLAMAAMLLGFALAGSTEATAAEYLSPSAVVADKSGKNLYVAEATARQVAVVEPASGKVIGTIGLSGRPSGLALSPDGKRLFVTLAEPTGLVAEVDVATRKVRRALPVGHTPVGVAVSPDGKTLYVCNRFDDSVSVVDLAAGKEQAKISVPREPKALAITPDGKTVFVVNHLPAGAADQDYVAATVSAIDTATRKVTSISLPNGSTDLQDVCVSPDGKYAYVSHILSRYHLPTTQLERGWMNTNALTIIDAVGVKSINTVLLDDVDKGAANPWGVATTADGKYICVAHAGTHEISVIDSAGVLAKLAKVVEEEKAARAKLGDKADQVAYLPVSAANVPNDLAFLVDLRRRLRLTGKGPRGIAVIGSKVYAAEYFSDSLGVVDIDPEVRPDAKSIALGPKKPLTVARKGELLFNDATICFQSWQSCASCHPDGRTDGLNWDLLNDDMGNPKNTKSMLLAHMTPPAMITGIRPNLSACVRAGIRFILFSVRPEEDAVAIETYLKSLKPVPSPYLVNGKLSAAAERGKKLFDKAACGTCHMAPLYTDRRLHDVGLGPDNRGYKDFDTPTLVEAWRSAPYLYDGRAFTMHEVLKKHNAKQKHGKTAGLTEKELADLAEFVLSQ